MMYFISWAGICLLIGIQLAAGTAPVANWTVANFARYCEPSGAICYYNFVIQEPESPPSGVPCAFEVFGAGGKSANETAFPPKGCVDNSQYQVSGGWDSQGFTVFTIENTPENTYAWFGYTDSQLANNAESITKSEPAYVVGTSRRSPWFASPHSPRSTASSCTWAAENLVRQIFYSPTKNVTWYNFTITDYAGNRSPCEIILDLPLGEDPETQSWYDIQCTNSPWFISWGYYPAGDAAVLTVVSGNRSEVAFFGWNNVNADHVLGNAGPNPVYSCKC